MPFGLKLRRTRRYNVLSKNCFVTRIRLLDSSVIECTLSVESTGQECLEAVAQRLELREVRARVWGVERPQHSPGTRLVSLSLVSKHPVIPSMASLVTPFGGCGDLLWCCEKQGYPLELAWGWGRLGGGNKGVCVAAPFAFSPWGGCNESLLP